MADTTLSPIKQKKADSVAMIAEKIKRAKALIVTDFSGLKHKQLEELRKSLKKVEAEFVVAKNSLLVRAFTATGKTVGQNALPGASAPLFAFGDEAGAVKELVQFFKTAAAGKVKIGILGTDELSEDAVNRLATLPGRDMLLSKLVGQLQAPLSGLHNGLSWNIRTLVWTLDGIKNKKQ